MAIEFVTCPVCGQKLAIYNYLIAGTSVVCANPTCEASLRITQHNPLKIDLIPVEETFNVDNRPESYG